MAATFEDRQRWCNAQDPEFQGDGWRWTLSLWLPGVPLPWWGLSFDGHRVRRTPESRNPLFHLDLLPLTRAQRQAVYQEWRATQQWYAQQARDGAA